VIELICYRPYSRQRESTCAGHPRGRRLPWLPYLRVVRLSNVKCCKAQSGLQSMARDRPLCPRSASAAHHVRPDRTGSRRARGRASPHTEAGRRSAGKHREAAPMSEPLSIPPSPPGASKLYLSRSLWSSEMRQARCGLITHSQCPGVVPRRPRDSCPAGVGRAGDLRCESPSRRAIADRLTRNHRRLLTPSRPTLVPGDQLAGCNVLY
jgi:hypothetical protein